MSPPTSIAPQSGLSQVPRHSRPLTAQDFGIQPLEVSRVCQGSQSSSPSLRLQLPAATHWLALASVFSPQQKVGGGGWGHDSGILGALTTVPNTTVVLTFGTLHTSQWRGLLRWTPLAMSPKLPVDRDRTLVSLSPSQDYLDDLMKNHKGHIGVIWWP